MTKTIAILGTMDTKGAEADFMRSEIESASLPSRSNVSAVMRRLAA